MQAAGRAGAFDEPTPRTRRACRVLPPSVSLSLSLAHTSRLPRLYLETRSAGRRSGGKQGEGGAADDGGFQAAGGRKKKGSKKADPSMLGFSVESSRIMQGEIQFADGS